MQSLPFGTEQSAITLRWYQEEAEKALWLGMKTESPCVVLPTGGGKSLVIAAVLRRVLAFNGRAMVLQPSKELIQQNADECRALMPGVDVGLYSAGLGKRHTEHDIVFAGIQSCYDKAHLFGRRDVCLIDESHLLPPDGEGRFRTFFKGMKDLCPHMRIGGLTATPFRTGSGALCGPDNLLTKVVFSASVSRLMEEGYLCKIVNRPMQSELDTSGLKIVSRTHEFDAGQAESLFDQDDNVNAAVDEIVEKAAGRRSILVFCSGVKHAEHVADRLASVSGEDVGLVTGGTLAIERANTIQRFKSGQLRWLVNVDVLTTGFNAKQVDCICMLRATASPGLFAQIVGRGFRVHPDKQDCLICDFGENVKRHGPIDSPDYGIPPEKPKKETGAGMPSKECPACFEAIPISATRCPECGFEYPPKPKHEANADTESAILQSQVEPTIYVVESASFHRHEKKNAPDAPNTLRVDYVCQLADGGGNLTRQVISEWVCLDHDGFARRNADKWWHERSNAVLVEDLNESRIDSAIDWWHRGAVAIANTIWVVPQGRFRKITKQELDDIPETWADEQEAVAAQQRAEFSRLYGTGNCSCHISPPCSSCIHPGNPMNQEAVAFAYDASGFDAVGGDLPF